MNENFLFHYVFALLFLFSFFTPIFNIYFSLLFFTCANTCPIFWDELLSYVFIISLIFNAGKYKYKLRITFIISHLYWYIMLSFSFKSRRELISLQIYLLDDYPIVVCIEFNFQNFNYILAVILTDYLFHIFFWLSNFVHVYVFLFKFIQTFIHIHLEFIDHSYKYFM